MSGLGASAACVLTARADGAGAAGRGWVASLDEMRLRDMATIQQLEAKLRQWCHFE